MAIERTCDECGAELPANAPQGLCPHCLAGMGLGLLPAEALPKSDFVIERTGTMIGRYKLLEKIGEGGFGVVYMAEQVEPVQRKVALKIIKAGMDTKEVIARFEAERQAIALMDHPNIARALDAGATEAGRPYFVMELVRGIPITDYCDRENLPTQERLQLFMKVCQAVQHAHQKGVIHRDIKPSNVLVTQHDGEPVPKVIDFGVAKALGQKLTEKTLFTGFQHMIGTPAYMSPEQAALSGLDIDTRADIYSLGVLLYELLTGVTPFDAETFRKAAMDEVRRMIRETEPPKPSTRLQTLGDKLTEVAKHRCMEPAALSRLLRGDLDWIVMRCLEKDRQRRYETANGLAADVARHLDSEPVVARPPSNLYRCQKMFRRHKLACAAASAVAASLIIGLGVSTWFLFKEKEARRRADVAETIQSQLRLNLIFNGSFELPTHAGHGRTFSTEESFDLPGWTFSTGIIQFFLEYGEPQRRARYADGRQAVCLNGDGRQPPAMLAQTFATTPGENYTLTFAQGDEEMAGPSSSELTVSIADVRRVFSREHDTGMVVKSLHFTARSNLTTLRFVDTSPSTPDIVHNPFLDAVSVIPDSLEIPVTNHHAIGTAKLGCPYPVELLVSPGGKASWSPGSDRIAFTKLGGGLAILDLQSRRVTDLTSIGNDPAWSPDGRFIAYVTSPGVAYYSEEVWIVPATGGQPVNIGHGGFPGWSADSRQVLFEDRKAGKILAARVDGRNEAPTLFFEHKSSLYPAVSSDGERIAFGASEQMTVVERKSGQTLAKLPAPGERGFLPAWSPDGRQVGFGGFAGSQAGLWIYDVQRGGAFQVAKNGNCTMPAWSPDGKRLVFDYRGDPNEIWMIETNNLPSSPVLVAQLPSRSSARQAETEMKPTAMKLVGKPVPKAFKLPLLTGGEIELPPSTNHGPLLLDFCASWCPPCREAMPVLAGIAKDYAGRGVLYVTVNQGEAPETIRRYLANARLNVSVALDKPSAIDSGGWCIMAKAFRVEAIPTIVIVDRFNTIRYVHVGAGPELGDELKRALDEVLRE